ncbi:MAG: hypothetical protein R3E12_15665, partial [Candidatus Eisenbacteria bacterium]
MLVVFGSVDAQERLRWLLPHRPRERRREDEPRLTRKAQHRLHEVVHLRGGEPHRLAAEESDPRMGAERHEPCHPPVAEDETTGQHPVA